MKNSETIYGASANSDEMATVKIDGGSADIDSSSIINVGNTGTASGLNNQVVRSTTSLSPTLLSVFNPTTVPHRLIGFTSTDNTVGVDVYGGMSLPTIYR